MTTFNFNLPAGVTAQLRSNSVVPLTSKDIMVLSAYIPGITLVEEEIA